VLLCCGSFIPFWLVFLTATMTGEPSHSTQQHNFFTMKTLQMILSTIDTSFYYNFMSQYLQFNKAFFALNTQSWFPIWPIAKSYREMITRQFSNFTFSVSVAETDFWMKIFLSFFCWINPLTEITLTRQESTLLPCKKLEM